MNGIGWFHSRLVDGAGGPVLIDDRGDIVGWRVSEVVVADTLAGVALADSSANETVWEIDEATHAVTTDPIRVTIRHSIDQTWSIRILVHNTGQEQIRLDRLCLGLDLGDDWTAWAAAVGADAMVALLGHAPGQVLGFTVLQGELRRDGDQLVINDLLLAPGAHHVVRIRGDWYTSASALARQRPTGVPPRDWWEVGAVVELEHPDQALVSYRTVCDDELLVPYETEQFTELESGQPDQVVIELAGPRGRSEVVVGFAPRLGDLVASFLEQAERRWPMGRQGPRVDSVAEGVILQHHDRFGERGRIRYDDGQDALDGLVERMADDSLLAVALLAEQAMRTADPALAERAGRALETIGTDAGSVLVTLPVMAARAMTGLDQSPPEPVDAVAGRSDGPLSLVTLLSAAVADPRQRDAAVHTLGAQWGQGLHGERLPAPDLVHEARLVALATLLGQFDLPQPAGWALEWEDLLVRQHCRLRGELWLRLREEPELVAQALAWLLLAP